MIDSVIDSMIPATGDFIFVENWSFITTNYVLFAIAMCV